nr:hypothetical protein [uncultured Alistipes sp.]
MKRINFIIVSIMTLLFTGLFAFAGGGGGLKYKPYLPEKDPGTPTPPTQKSECSEKYKESTYSLFINELHLRYDLTDNATIDNGDLAQLRSAHSEIVDRKGEIRYLSTIVQGIQSVLDNSRAPVCKVVVTGTDCTGNITKNYTDDMDVLGNNVQGIPYFGLQLQTMKFEIKTIKTIGHDLQLCWEASLNFQQTSGCIVIDKKANVQCTKSAFYIVGPPQDMLPVRKRIVDDLLIYEPISNCTKEIYIEDTTELRYEKEPAPISPTLSKPVYSNGALIQKARWDEPELLTIKEIL